MTSLKNSTTPSTIQQYNKQLQVQNQQRMQEIQALKKQIDLYALSAKLQILNSPPPCQQCLRKEQEIETLIKALKMLRGTNVLEKTISANDSKRDMLSQDSQNTKSRQYIQICMQQAQVSFPIVQQVQIPSKNVNHIQFSTESNEIDLEALKQANSRYQRQIQILKKRLLFFEQKIGELEQSNRLLAKEIMENRKSSKTVFKNSNLTQRSEEQRNRDESIIQYYYAPQTKKKAPLFSSIRNQVIKNGLLTPYSQSISVAPKMYKIETTRHSKHSEINLKQKTKCDCSPFHSSHQKTLNYQQQTNSRRCKSRGQDILQQRRRSLNYKIKVLQYENKKLRREMQMSNH